MRDPTAYERVKRRRDRERRNVCCVMVEIGEAEIDTLTREAGLPERDADNPFAIAAALKRMITRNHSA